MRRSRSGQVLVAAATLMLAVLLVSAMSIPVINTDIEPSSKIFNIVRVTISNAVEDLITYMSAYQCASTIVKKKQSLDFSYIVKTQYLGKILDKVWTALQSAAKKDDGVARALQNLKRLKVDLESAYIHASADGWSPNKAGTVRIHMRLNIWVTIEWYGNKPTKIISWTEEVEITSNSIKTKVEGMLPWQGVEVLEQVLGFVPILDAISGNVRSIKPRVYLDVVDHTTGALEAYIDKEEGIKEIGKIYSRSDPEILESRMLVGLLSPRKVTETGPNFIQWEEHSHIDYAGLTIALILDLIPLSKLGKLRNLFWLVPIITPQTKEFVEYAVETEYNPNILSPNINIKKVGKDTLDNFYDKKKVPKGQIVSEIEETQGASINLGQRNPAFDQFLKSEVLEKQSKGGIQNLIEESVATKIQQSKTVAGKKQVAQKFVQSFTKALDELLGEGGGNRGADLGEGGFLYGPAEITLSPTQAGGKKLAYFDSQDPLLFVALPLHGGNALFAACLWIDGVHPRK
jgi:hypothetical protein